MIKIRSIDQQFLKENLDNFLSVDVDFPGGQWSAESFLYDLPGKWKYSIALINGDEIIGFIIASDKGRFIHIHRFAIHKQWRNSKLGEKLLLNFEKYCKVNSRNEISLNVSTENHNGAGFYERHGFIRGDVDGGNLLMTKKLKIVVAIHQPNLFPWIGFFDKIMRSDIFIILDHVANRPNDAIYTKRVQILNNKAAYWLTIPLLKPKGVEFVSIKEMLINLNDDFSRKQLKTIEANYRKTAFFADIFPAIERFYNSDEQTICARNINFIKDICTELGINTPFFYSSEMNCTSNATDLLIELTKKTGGNIYLAGGGAEGYQQDQLFNQSGVELEYQNFVHPHYKQAGTTEFVKGLSIIDCLMNNGFEKTKEILVFPSSQKE